MFAGAQSLKLPTASMGWSYLPLDIRQFVFSAEQGCVVHNVEIDFTQHDPASSLRFTDDQIFHQFPRACIVRWRVCWASEDCSTFSKMDQINVRKGTAYRDSSHPERTPLNPDVSEHGMKAREADKRVENTVAFLLALRSKRGVRTLSLDGRYVTLDTTHLQVALENPVGNLQFRPHMKASMHHHPPQW